MGLFSSLLNRKDIWERILVERLTEPIHLNVISLFVLALGTTRAKIALDLLVRQQHAHGMLYAADTAKRRRTGSRHRCRTWRRQRNGFTEPLRAEPTSDESNRRQDPGHRF